MAIAKKPVTIGAVALVVLAGVAFYIRYDRYSRYFQETNDATIQADQVAISSKLAGYVEAVLVQDNQAIGKNAELVRIDALDYRTRLDASVADLNAALGSTEVAAASRAETVAAAEQSRAALKAAEANLALASREVARYGPLVSDGAEPASALSQWIANRDRARADVAAQRAAVDQAARHVDTVEAQARQFGAQAEAARVRRLAAGNDVSSTRMRSPIAGRVANLSVRVGQYVQPGNRLMTVVPAQGLYVVANFKETQLGLMRPGQPATIRVDALPGVEFTGRVVSVTPGTGANFSLIPPQNATGNFTKIVQRVPVRIRIDAGPAARRVLVPGLSLEVEVDTRAGRKELDAIRAEQKG